MSWSLTRAPGVYPSKVADLMMRLRKVTGPSRAGANGSGGVMRCLPRSPGGQRVDAEPAHNRVAAAAGSPGRRRRPRRAERRTSRPDGRSRQQPPCGWPQTAARSPVSLERAPELGGPPDADPGEVRLAGAMAQQGAHAHAAAIRNVPPAGGLEAAFGPQTAAATSSPSDGTRRPRERRAGRVTRASAEPMNRHKHSGVGCQQTLSRLRRTHERLCRDRVGVGHGPGGRREAARRGAYRSSGSTSRPSKPAPAPGRTSSPTCRLRSAGATPSSGFSRPQANGWTARSWPQASVPIPEPTGVASLPR